MQTREADIQRRITVCGAGGFIGGHLVADLVRQGCTQIRAVDKKPLEMWFQRFDEAENLLLDLSHIESCKEAVHGAQYVFNLAADMGGMGFIENNKALCMLSVLINTHLLQAAHDSGVERYFFASSACVYNAEKQKDFDVAPLREEDAYPAMPEDGYGWEKLFSERMCRHFSEDFGLETRVARFHNVYGPLGTFDGGREKAPAALCRKIAQVKLTGKHEIEIWGTGEQTRSFMYIDDCIKGIQLIMDSGIGQPINLGSSELVTINVLLDTVENAAGTKVGRRYDVSMPKGVNGRNSDNTAIKQHLGWEPPTSLSDGVKETFDWIYGEVEKRSMSQTLGPSRFEVA